jgi:DNA repair and recombination RAD54-like protein
MFLKFLPNQYWGRNYRFNRRETIVLYVFSSSSDTHDKLKCRRCVANIEVKPPPEDSDCNSDMSQWYHASSKKGLVDYELKQLWDAGITFVFHHKSHDQIKVL